MSQYYLAGAIGALAVVLAAVWWRRSRRNKRRADERLAMTTFDPRSAEQSESFIKAAAATGKPRGLHWKSCELAGPAAFAHDRATAELYAFVAATISFEAIAGGDMEEVEAVSNLRSATAVFIRRDGRWTTDGRVVFNLDPQQTIAHYQETLEPAAP